MIRIYVLISALALTCCTRSGKNYPANGNTHESRFSLADTIQHSMRSELLDAWYPRAVDTAWGGFITTFSHDWNMVGKEDKMIVTQARHTWVTARASEHYPGESVYKAASASGFLFLKNKMWDHRHGGFHSLVSREGTVIDSSKNAYGNAFAIYALSAYYHASGDTAALALAKKTFWWLEYRSHDPAQKGYFQHMDHKGTPIVRTHAMNSNAETGYKDQNSSIHLLEAFTALYGVWPDPLVRERLAEMLYLIRDVMVTRKGYLTLFFTTNWQPVSYRDSSQALLDSHHNLDHVSYGHDVETAYLMMEASEILGIKNDTTTWRIAKRMVDHALTTGWDSTTGGFYDEGYYFKDSDTIHILKDSKNWWAQAEGLNTLLIMADTYPADEMNYYEKFQQQWHYINRYVIDHKFGDWFAGGLDKEPFQEHALKGHMWKACYHQYRALENCTVRLRTPPRP